MAENGAKREDLLVDALFCFIFAVATAAASAVILLLIVVVCLFVFSRPWETANIVLFGCVDRLLPTPKKSTIISTL